MPIVCPTVTASTPEEYKQQIELVAGLSPRLHLDLMDGLFAPIKSVDFKQIWWPKSASRTIDLHVMYERPQEAVEFLVSLRPQLIILHAEADPREVAASLDYIHRHPPIKPGLALLPATEPTDVVSWLSKVEHCLLFSGDLGHFGGQADLSLTAKIDQLLELNPNLEIGWDGGINRQNAGPLVAAGVEVLNVGGGIHNQPDPAEAYAILQQIADSKH